MYEQRPFCQCKNITKIIFASVDKSPHCIQLHYIQEKITKLGFKINFINYVASDNKLIDDLTNKATEILQEILNKYKVVNVIAIKSQLVARLSQYIYDKIEHRPYIVPIVNVI